MKTSFFSSKIVGIFLAISISLFLFSTSTTNIPVIAYTPVITFSDPTLVSIKDDYDDIYTSIVSDSSNNSHIVWHERMGDYWSEVRYRKYFSAFDSWSSIETLAIGDFNTRSSFPKIKIDFEDNLHIVWSENNYTSGTFLKKYRRITEGSLSETKTLDLENVSNSRAYDFVPLSFDEIFFIYDRKNSSSLDNLFFSFYYPSTNTWSPEIQINITSENHHWPKATTDSKKNIHFAWPDAVETGEIELYYQCFNYSTSELELQEPLLISKIDDNRTWIIRILADKFDTIHFSYLENSYPYSASHYRYLSNYQLSDDYTIRSSDNTLDSEIDIFADCNNIIHFSWTEYFGSPQIPMLFYQQFDNLSTWSEIITKEIGHQTVTEAKLSVTLDGDIHIVMNNYNDGDWCVYFFLGTDNLTSSPSPTTSLAYPSLIIIAFYVILVMPISKKLKKK